MKVYGLIQYSLVYSILSFTSVSVMLSQVVTSISSKGNLIHSWPFCYRESSPSWFDQMLWCFVSTSARLQLQGIWQIGMLSVWPIVHSMSLTKDVTLLQTYIFNHFSVYKSRRGQLCCLSGTLCLSPCERVPCRLQTAIPVKSTPLLDVSRSFSK